MGGFFLGVFLALEFEEWLENNFAVSRNVWNWMSGWIKGLVWWRFCFVFGTLALSDASDLATYDMLLHFICLGYLLL